MKWDNEARVKPLESHLSRALDLLLFSVTIFYDNDFGPPTRTTHHLGWKAFADFSIRLLVSSLFSLFTLNPAAHAPNKRELSLPTSALIVIRMYLIWSILEVHSRSLYFSTSHHKQTTTQRVGVELGLSFVLCVLFFFVGAQFFGITDKKWKIAGFKIQMEIIFPAHMPPAHQHPFRCWISHHFLLVLFFFLVYAMRCSFMLTLAHCDCEWERSAAMGKSSEERENWCE